jgi:hypothetical protein
MARYRIKVPKGFLTTEYKTDKPLCITEKGTRIIISPKGCECIDVQVDVKESEESEE